VRECCYLVYFFLWEKGKIILWFIEVYYLPLIQSVNKDNIYFTYLIHQLIFWRTDEYHIILNNIIHCMLFNKRDYGTSKHEALLRMVGIKSNLILLKDFLLRFFLSLIDFMQCDVYIILDTNECCRHWTSYPTSFCMNLSLLVI